MSAAGLGIPAALAQATQVVIVDRAATLTLPFDTLARNLPTLECRQRSAGSRFLLHSDVDLNQPVDVLALADVTLFEKPGSPAQTARFPWWSTFAGNEIGIAYTARSKAADQISAANWPQILQQSGVQTAYSDPETDPEGYNTVIAWTLAESYYHLPGFAARLRAAIPQKNIRSDSTQLLALLSAGEVDYAWEYRSVAEQHQLKFLRLPKQINLSDPSLAQCYKNACIDLHHAGTVQQQCGRPILYAVAIAADAPHPEAAAQFVQALYGDAGRNALQSAFQQPLAAKVGGDIATAPDWLKMLAK
ncbi:extracellular solute-binding protein [Acidisarcina polymorpha]|uniref:extracellular solute-binding protein n=1 Tax=Acidisarcina polymorpha TaxID=2211140 RepID=UPI001F443D30|nr:extracellular solute-binding protein [Acidisarcina polymorpha]